MNDKHKAIRALLQSMAPKRATSYIQSFELPTEEELFLIECDVRRKSVIQAAQDNHVTPEVVKNRKRSAYHHISDQLHSENF